MKNKKVFLLSTDFPPSEGGGIGVHAFFLCNELRERGYEVIVLSEYYIDSSLEKINQYSKKHGIKIYKLQPAPSFYELFKKVILIYKLSAVHKPDLIIGTGKHSVWFASFLSILIKKPLLTIGHGTEFTEKTSKYDFALNRLFFSRSNILICVSNYTKKIVIDCKIKAKKIVVIHNPADEQRFFELSPNIISKFKIKNNIINNKILLSVGAMSHRKGQHFVIKSLEKVIKKIPNLIYIIIGLPYEKNKLKKIAKQCKVENNIIFKDIVSQNDLNLYYNSCDLFCMTSISKNGDFEGFGIAVKEAALCKKASIVSDSSGVAEAVKHNQTGIIVKQNNIEELSTAILDLFSNEKNLKRLSNNSLIDTAKNNTHKIIGEKYYSQILKII